MIGRGPALGQGEAGPPEGSEGPARRSSRGSLGPARAQGADDTAARRGRTAGPVRLELAPSFRCVPYSARLSAEQCAERHREPAVQRKTCKTCLVGKAHARGETPASWPDGRPIERSAIEAVVLVHGPPKGRRGA